MIFPRPGASISVEIPDLDAKIKAWKVLAPRAFDNGLEAGIRAATIMLSTEIKELLNDVVLHRRTSRLWRSIQPETFRRAGTIVGIVGTDVEYAAIHEFGGVIRPKNEGRYLVFEVGGEFRMMRQVEIPKRPYMSRAFKENQKRVGRMVQSHVIKALKGTLKSGRVDPVSGRKGVGYHAD